MSPATRFCAIAWHFVSLFDLDCIWFNINQWKKATLCSLTGFPCQLFALTSSRNWFIVYAWMTFTWFCRVDCKCRFNRRTSIICPPRHLQWESINQNNSISSLIWQSQQLQNVPDTVIRTRKKGQNYRCCCGWIRLGAQPLGVAAWHWFILMV